MMNKKGAAFLLALFSLIIVSLLVTAFLQAVTIDFQIVNNLELRSKALYIADAGVEFAIYQLKSNKSWVGTGGSVNFPDSNSNYNVTYSNVSGKITSIGSLASGEQVTLEIKVSVTGSLSPYQVKIIYWREV